MEDGKNKPCNPVTEAHKRNSRRLSQTYTPGSIREHLLYGVGATLVIVGPALIPGLTVKAWIAGFFGTAMSIYVLICLVGAWKSIRRHGR